MKNKLAPLVICSALFSFGAAHAANVTVNDATGNGAMATALNLDNNFDRNFDANITDQFGHNNISTSFFHASASATTGASGRDWYSFTTSQANVQAYFDIDNGMWDLDSWVNLYNSAGTLIAANDDGGVDPGSVHGYDSFLSTVLTNPGMYFVSVGRYPNQDLYAGQDYTLNVSLANHNAPMAATPIPAALWLFGSGIAGLMGLRRKTSLAAPLVAASY